MQIQYKVRCYLDDEYEVFKIISNYFGDSYEEVVFKGTLPECDAFISLTEKGHL